MKMQGSMKINSQGHLEIGGCDVIDLAHQWGTPLYILDEALIRKNCQEYLKAFSDGPTNNLVIYASKALLIPALCRILQEEGLGLDVVSGGELYIALSAGFPAEKIFFHGNNKSLAELEFALKEGIGRIVIDNFYEIQLLQKLAQDKGYKPKVLLRLTPGIEAHSHEYIRTGQIDSKFGFTLANGDALRAVKTVLASELLQLKGLHCHIGSQILELEPFGHTAKVMMEFLHELRQETGWVAEELDLGGGLGIYYCQGDRPPAISDYAQIIRAQVKSASETFNYPHPTIIVEPGRSLVGATGITIYTIGSIKEIPGVRKYIAVDGGMTDNPRPALYQARYEGLIANKANLLEQEVVSVAGRCCESGDMLIWDLKVPAVEHGDILAISSTGAYTYSMSSNYNCLPKAAIILVNEGQAKLAVARECYADLIKDQIPVRT